MSDLINTTAILLSPMMALLAQKIIEFFREKKQRKLYIFKTLMTTRANKISLEHVQALNMIDIEFYKEKKIIDLWNVYRDHLFSPPQNADEQESKQWIAKGEEYIADLLYEMGKPLGYDFDKVILKKGAYFPVAHGNLGEDQQSIRKSVLNILNGKNAIKINLAEQEKPAEEAQ